MNLTENDLCGRTGEVYAAALGVFRERSFADLDHAAVAGQSATEPRALARRWPRPADLLVDALVEEILPPPRDPGDRGLRTELIELTSVLAGEYARHGDLIVALLARLPHDPELNDVFRARILLPRLDCARKIFSRSILRAELRPDADPNLIFSVVPAIMTYRTMVGDPAPDRAFAEHVVDTVLLPLLLRLAQQAQAPVRERHLDALPPRQGQPVRLDPVAEHHERVRLRHERQAVVRGERALGELGARRG